MRKVVEAVQNAAKPKEKQLDSLSYRGLINFVQKVKKADEHPKKGGTSAVIVKELTHVFQELQKPNLSPYNRGKSVLKIVFVSMYGSHHLVASRIVLLSSHIDSMLQSSSFSLWAVALASLSLYPELHSRLIIELGNFVKSPKKHEPWRVRCLLQMVTYLHEISLELASALVQYILVLLQGIAKQRTAAPDDHLDNLTQKSCLTLCKLLCAHPTLVSLLIPHFRDVVHVCFSALCPSIGVHQSAAVFLRQCILAMNKPPLPPPPSPTHSSKKNLFLLSFATSASLSTDPPSPLAQQQQQQQQQQQTAARLDPRNYDCVIERCCVVLEEYLEVMPNHYGCEPRGIPQTLHKRDYKFYAVVHPWLTVAILQLLQALDPAHLLASPCSTRLLMALTPLLTAIEHKETHSQTMFHAITAEAIFLVRHLHGLSVYEWLKLLPLFWHESPLTPDLVSVVAEYIPTSTFLPLTALAFTSTSTSSSFVKGELNYAVTLHHLREKIDAFAIFDKTQSRLVNARLMRCFMNLPGNFSLVTKPVASKLGLEDWELHRALKLPHRGKTRDQRHYCDDPAFRLAREPASMSNSDLDELARIHQLHALAALVSDYCPSILEIRILEGKDLGASGASCTITGKHNVNTEKQDGFKRQTKFSECVSGPHTNSSSSSFFPFSSSSSSSSSSTNTSLPSTPTTDNSISSASSSSSSSASVPSSFCKWGAEDGAVWYDKIDPPIHCESLLIEVIDNNKNILGSVTIETKNIFERTIELHREDVQLRKESLERFVDLLGNNDPKEDSCLSESWSTWYPLTHSQPAEHHGSLRVCTRAIAGTTLARVVHNKITKELNKCNPKLVAIEQCAHQLRVMSQGSVFYQSLVGHSTPSWTPLKRLPAAQLWHVECSPDINEWEAEEIVTEEEIKEEEDLSWSEKASEKVSEKAMYQVVTENNVFEAAAENNAADDGFWEDMKGAVTVHEDKKSMDTRPSTSPRNKNIGDFEPDFEAFDREMSNESNSNSNNSAFSSLGRSFATHSPHVQPFQPQGSLRLLNMSSSSSNSSESSSGSGSNSKAPTITVHIAYQTQSFDIEIVPNATVSELLTHCRELLGVYVESFFLQLFYHEKLLILSSSLIMQGVNNFSTLHLRSDSLSISPSRPSLGPWNLVIREGGSVLDGNKKKHTYVKVFLEYKDHVPLIMNDLLPDAIVSVIQLYLLSDTEDPRGQLSIVLEPVNGGAKRVVALDPDIHYTRCFDDFRREKHSCVYRCMKITQGGVNKTYLKLATEISKDPYGHVLRSFISALQGWCARLFQMPKETIIENVKKPKKREVFIDWIETFRETSLEGKPAEIEQELVISLLGTNFSHDQTFKLGTTFTSRGTAAPPTKMKFLTNVVDARRWIRDQDIHFCLPSQRRFDLVYARPAGHAPPFAIFLHRGSLLSQTSSNLSFFSFTLSAISHLSPRVASAGKVELQIFLLLPSSWEVSRLISAKPSSSSSSSSSSSPSTSALSNNTVNGGNALNNSSSNNSNSVSSSASVGIMEYKGDGNVVYCTESRCIVWTLSVKDIKKIEKPSLTLTVAFPGVNPVIKPERMTVLAHSTISAYCATGGHVRFFKEFPSRGEIYKWVRYLTHYQACLDFLMDPSLPSLVPLLANEF